MNGNRIKIVEKAETKLQELLTCPGKEMIVREKDACCVKPKRYTGKNLKQKCKKRNLVYETFCITCEKREIQKIEEETKYEN